MKSRFLPFIEKSVLDQLLQSEDTEAFYDLLTQPLHEELYRRQDFNFLDELSEGQQLFLSYDYLRNQAGQGGFIQFLHNGYVGLLPPMPGWLNVVGAPEMGQIIDNALKLYVLNREKLEEDITPEMFAKLYSSLPEFIELDTRFNKLNEETIRTMVGYARQHLDEFIAF